MGVAFHVGGDMHLMHMNHMYTTAYLGDIKDETAVSKIRKYVLKFCQIDKI